MRVIFSQEARMGRIVEIHNLQPPGEDVCPCPYHLDFRYIRRERCPILPHQEWIAGIAGIDDLERLPNRDICPAARCRYIAPIIGIGPSK